MFKWKITQFLQISTLPYTIWAEDWLWILRFLNLIPRFFRRQWWHISCAYAFLNPDLILLIKCIMLKVLVYLINTQFFCFAYLTNSSNDGLPVPWDFQKCSCFCVGYLVVLNGLDDHFCHKSLNTNTKSLLVCVLITCENDKMELLRLHN